MKNTVWLYVKGDDFSAEEFMENYTPEEVYLDMVKEGVESKVISNECMYAEVEIKKFGNVDEDFVSFMKDNLCDYDFLKSADLFKVDLNKIESKSKESREGFSKGMELGNMFFGNSRGEFEVNSVKKEDLIHGLIELCGAEPYGELDEDSKYYNELTGGFKNDVFEINPYYWGLDDKLKVIPNFKFYKTGYELKWYKYPLRDSYANKDLNDSEFELMVKECMDSLK